MYYIKLEEDMTLTTTVWEPIYRGDRLNQKITYLVPLQIGDVDMLTATIFLNFIRADGEPDVVILEREEEKYNEQYFQYKLPVTCKLSRYAGEVCTWMQIYSGAISNPVISKSSENIIQVMESKNMDDYVSYGVVDRAVTALYQMKKQIDDGFTRVDSTFEQVNDQLDAIVAAKADNLIFDEEESTIQLTANGEPIGEKIYVNASKGKLLTNMKLTTDGELLAFYSDDTIQNLGKVKGEDGMVYVPHIDEHGVLTFSLESSDALPDTSSMSMDLNPNDDWHEITDNMTNSDYIWENI